MKINRIAHGFIVVLAAVFLVVSGQSVSHAVPGQGPDPRFTSGRMNYVVSRDGYTDINKSLFRIYTTRIDQGVTVRIYGQHLCTNRNVNSKLFTMGSSPVTTDEQYNNIDIPYEENVTRFRLLTSGGTYRDTVNGVRKSAANCNRYAANRSADVRISAADLRGYQKNNTIGQQGMYEFSFRAETWAGTFGFVNGFRLEVLNDPGAVISQEPYEQGADARNFGIQIASPRDRNYYGDFQIPFGPDCLVKNNGKTASIFLYDLDNPSSVQPNSFRLRVSRYNSNQQRLRTEPIRNSDIIGASSVANSGDYKVIRSGDRDTVEIRFTVRPQYKYTLDIDNVFNNNTLQLSIPYSTVWFTQDCNSIANTAQLAPDLTLQPLGDVIPVGGQFQANFTAAETGGKFNAEMRSGAARVWRENNGDDSFDARDGDESLHSDTVSNRTIRSGRPFRDQYTWTVPNVGSGRICASWNVVAGSNTQLAGNGSITKCKYIGKSPLINVLGGDIRAGSGGSTGDIIGSMTTIGGNRYGSWAEYGMFAPGQISNFASGGVLSSDSLRNLVRPTIPLTFANSPSPGNFQTTMEARGTPVSSIFDKVDQTSPGAWTTLTGSSYTVPNGSGIHRIRSNSTGQITLNGASNISGVVLIDAPNAHVVIVGNITYSNGPFTSINQMPLALINAKSISFASGVTQVDAGLQASGSISTCGNPPSTNYYDGLRLSSLCNNNSLRLNGFVSAGSLYLRRTAGADGKNDKDRAIAAEEFNLRSDAILKINQMTQGDGISIRTTSITELPPRL